MKTIWFKKLGWIYIPISAIGYVLYLLTFIFCFTVIAAANRHAHSVSDFLYGIFPFIVCAFLLLFWVASNTSTETKN